MAAKTPSATNGPRITPEARKLLGQLVKKQDRAWFAKNKERFHALLTASVEAVLREAGPLLMRAFPAVEDAQPKVFRIYRDIRFSKDKSPFKDHVGGELSLGPASLYLHVGVEEVFGAAGPWILEPEALKRFRAAVAGSAAGPALLKETHKLIAAGYELHSHDKLARAPAGVDPAHPCIELLRHKGYALVLPRPSSKTLVDGSLPRTLAEHVIKAKRALDLVAAATRP